MTMEKENLLGIVKTVRVYTVTSESGVNRSFPTNAKAKECLELLEHFGINATVETVKHKVTV